MAYDITNSFLEEFDYRFHSMLHQRGSALMDLVTVEPVVGATKYLRQSSVGDAHFVTSCGSPTEYVAIKYDKRKLEPKPIECPIMLDKYDLVMQGSPDIGMLAQEAADSCGKLIDQIIIKGISGPAYTAASGEVKLPESQNIKYKDTLLVDPEENEVIKDGLNTGKVAKAVQMLRSEYNNSPLICVASNYALATLRADKRAASSLFNTQPAMATGQNTPFGGCDVFVASEQVERGRAEDGKEIEYAYMYAIDQIKLGTSMPLTLDYGKNAERGLSDVLIYRGMYDCVRMQEKSVVRIEVFKHAAGVNNSGSNN